MKIVCFGGGTGLPILLRGLRLISCSRPESARRVSLTAVVCVSDNGGSSGSLRDSFGIPAVGDLRNCLVALAHRSSPLGNLFQHRLGKGEGLSGHALGNLVVTALCERTGSLLEAVSQAGNLLQSWGRVLPSTEQSVTLCAEFEDGAVVRGEQEASRHTSRISRMWLEPEEARPTPGLTASILSADVIVFGPGSLYTSIVPNLLIQGIAGAIRRSGAMKVLVCNLLTQAGETDGFRASDHLFTMERYLGPGSIDVCILHDAAANADRGGPGGPETTDSRGAHPVENDIERIRRHGTEPVVADVLCKSGCRTRHDSVKLASAILRLAAERDRSFVSELARYAALREEQLSEARRANGISAAVIGP